MKGNIIDIKKFTVHDGPGIRNTVFLKGCPLRCAWCHNPEGLDVKIGLWYFEKKCIGCNNCIRACKNGALSIGGKPHIIIDYERCTNMGECVEACPTEALCFDGREMDSEQIVEILSEDMPFYEESGGGITLSGGDPLFQPEFSLEILKACKDKKIHTAIETCMYARQDIIEKFLDFTDLFIVDLKIFDSYKHKMYTGVENELIKSNFRFIASQKTDILVRIPLIPGITATDENLRKTARFVRDTNPEIPIELMNYNILAENKYRLMKKENNLIKGMKPFLEARLEEFYRIIEGEGARILKDTKIGN